MQESLLNQGAELMIYGMGTVFVFLTLLVILTTTMSALIQRYLPTPVPKPAAPKANAGATQTVPEDTQLIAVISAAIAQHRSRQK